MDDREAHSGKAIVFAEPPVATAAKTAARNEKLNGREIEIIASSSSGAGRE